MRKYPDRPLVGYTKRWRGDGPQAAPAAASPPALTVHAERRAAPAQTLAKQAPRKISASSGANTAQHDLLPASNQHARPGIAAADDVTSYALRITICVQEEEVVGLVVVVVTVVVGVVVVVTVVVGVVVVVVVRTYVASEAAAEGAEGVAVVVVVLKSPPR